MKYLSDKGLTLETLKEFQIGYQGVSGELLGSTFPQSLKVKLNTKYNNAVLIPCHDVYGDALSIMVRRFAGEPKFVYEEGFKAHNHLFGLYKTVLDIVKQDYVVLVEGPFDAMSCYQNGIKNVVAVLGTSLTHAQVCLLLRFTDKWLAVFDGDTAGQEASRKIMVLGKQLKVDIKTLSLPPPQDPDDFLKKEGKKGWEALCARYLKNTFADPQVQITPGTYSIPVKLQLAV